MATKVKSKAKGRHTKTKAKPKAKRVAAPKKAQEPEPVQPVQQELDHEDESEADRIVDKGLGELDGHEPVHETGRDEGVDDL